MVIAPAQIFLNRSSNLKRRKCKLIFWFHKNMINILIRLSMKFENMWYFWQQLYLNILSCFLTVFDKIKFSFTYFKLSIHQIYRALIKQFLLYKSLINPPELHSHDKRISLSAAPLYKPLPATHILESSINSNVD